MHNRGPRGAELVTPSRSQRLSNEISSILLCFYRAKQSKDLLYVFTTYQLSNMVLCSEGPAVTHSPSVSDRDHQEKRESREMKGISDLRSESGNETTILDKNKCHSK